MGSNSNPSSSSTKEFSNFQTLLQSLTPNVPLIPVREDCVKILDKELNPSGKPVNEYFILSDLWKGLEEWSAFGQGTSVLAGGKNMVQYFSPHLSALHLITKKKIEEETKINISTKRKLTESSWGPSSEEEDEHIETCPNRTYLKFYNKTVQFKIAPFFDKIKELAHIYPELMTLRSIDLNPSSWMAIAWYPIYHTPNTVLVLEDFSTAFITYHYLSSFCQAGSTTAEHSQLEYVIEGLKAMMYRNKVSTQMPLCPFGLAAKDLNGDVWFNGAADMERFTALNQAAVSWVSKCNFFHHDLNHFSLHNLRGG